MNSDGKNTWEKWFDFILFYLFALAGMKGELVSGLNLIYKKTNMEEYFPPKHRA